MNKTEINSIYNALAKKIGEPKCLSKRNSKYSKNCRRYTCLPCLKQGRTSQNQNSRPNSGDFGTDNAKKMAKNCPSLAYFTRKIYMQIAKTNL